MSVYNNSSNFIRLDTNLISHRFSYFCCNLNKNIIPRYLKVLKMLLLFIHTMIFFKKIFSSKINLIYCGTNAY